MTSLQNDKELAALSLLGEGIYVWVSHRPPVCTYYSGHYIFKVTTKNYV